MLHNAPRRERNNRVDPEEPYLELYPRWRRWWLPILAIGGGLIAAIGGVAFLYNRLPPSLLAVVVGAILAFGSGLALQILRRYQENETLRRQEAVQEVRERVQEERNRQRELLINEKRSQDAALWAYLSSISTLILDHDLSQTPRDSDVRRLAQAWTTMLLLELEGNGKWQLLKLLYELNLISRTNPIIELRNAALMRSRLKEADLEGASLVQADLRDAYLESVNFSGSDLSGSDLRDAYLKSINFSGADLTGTDLTGAEGITNEELEYQAASLEGATMPHGQKYEDWLKDKKAKGKDEKNE
jgi:Pentapeptide repeats (8 copies)